MANDNWYGKSFETIQKQLSALANNNAQALVTDWYNVSQIVHQSLEAAKTAHDKLNDPKFWTGAGPEAAQASMRTNLQEQVTDDGLQSKTYNMSAALANDGGTLNASAGVPGRHKLPKDATDSEREEATYQLAQDAQRTYSTPMDWSRPKIENAADSPGGGSIQQPGGGGGGGGNSGGGSGNNLQSPGGGTDGLANKDTKPQLANGEGQGGQGQGQGAGSGSGSGSGGGQGAGSGSGAGAGGSSPFGSGTGTGTGGSGLPLGATTAAGYGSSGSAGGTGLASGTAGGASALRAGGGLPGGATSGAGTNPAAVGAAGVRGGAMGPMGMMGGAGAHGKGGHDEDDDHETPAILINLDNTYEFMGDLPKASPAVIGDWSEQEKADKQAQEREKQRYKKLGWDVKYE
ncbi:hypothetical protein BKG83_05515 [Mycobacteroides chelonae]|jgi:hypothetical protein|uniref:hypothetical protein n=1 Tax=Mycobacteroides chelonae TaxID=1774 RepID=UPI0008AA2EE1|nr:hypothetical protein [Mycobacteroides chelonae]MBF9524048.1 hypothetical protein [Mycobacteroides chelonae]OHU57187.1 hypothetical protein BKG83_05515 [Mycobacteroides chelonae]SKL32498.1 Uncharacterised protein [Mycobacteroides abscessus subsp. bolletii]